MKNKLINFSISTTIVFILGIILSLVVSLLSYFNVISLQLNDYLIIGISFLLFFLFGLIYGSKERKRGLLNGLLLTIFYLGFMFLFKMTNPSYTYSSWYITLARCSLIILGSVIGVNINHD